MGSASPVGQGRRRQGGLDIAGRLGGKRQHRPAVLARFAWENKSSVCLDGLNGSTARGNAAEGRETGFFLAEECLHADPSGKDKPVSLARASLHTACQGVLRAKQVFGRSIASPGVGTSCWPRCAGAVGAINIIVIIIVRQSSPALLRAARRPVGRGP